MQITPADITQQEWEHYLRDLIPILRRYPAHHWVPISSIANNVERFVAIVDYFAAGCEFMSRNRVQLIEINGDETLIRLIPDAIEHPDRYEWSYVKPNDYFYDCKICGKKQVDG